MGKVTQYGALLVSKVADEMAKEELEIDVIGECNMADSVAKLSDPPADTPEILKTLSIEEQAVYIQKNLKARCAALLTFLKEGQEKLNVLEKDCESMEVWMKEDMAMTQKVLKGRNMIAYVERFYGEAKKLFREKSSFKRGQRIEGKDLPKDW